MTMTPITTSCHNCGTQVEAVFHVMLCNDCLEARLEPLEQVASPA